MRHDGGQKLHFPPGEPITLHDLKVFYLFTARRGCFRDVKEVADRAGITVCESFVVLARELDREGKAVGTRGQLRGKDSSGAYAVSAPENKATAGRPPKESITDRNQFQPPTLKELMPTISRALALKLSMRAHQLEKLDKPVRFLAASHLPPSRRLAMPFPAAAGVRGALNASRR